MTTNKMQLFWLIYSQSALHVSGDVFAHRQEHLTVFTASTNIAASWYHGWDEQLHLSSMITAGSSIGGQYQKL